MVSVKSPNESYFEMMHMKVLSKHTVNRNATFHIHIFIAANVE